MSKWSKILLTSWLLIFTASYASSNNIEIVFIATK